MSTNNCFSQRHSIVYYEHRNVTASYRRAAAKLASWKFNAVCRLFAYLDLLQVLQEKGRWSSVCSVHICCQAGQAPLPKTRGRPNVDAGYFGLRNTMSNKLPLNAHYWCNCRFTALASEILSYDPYPDCSLIAPSCDDGVLLLMLNARSWDAVGNAPVFALIVFAHYFCRLHQTQSSTGIHTFKCSIVC